MCGTILSTRPKGEKGEGDRAWVSLYEADARYQKLWGTYNPKSGLMESFEGGEEVLVPTGGDASGLYSISILDPDVSYGLPVIHYFDTMIDYLTVSLVGWWDGVEDFGNQRTPMALSQMQLANILRDFNTRPGHYL